MFKRRTQLSFRERVSELIYPRSGWRRATIYALRRILRLPDTPHRIALGLSCGVLACFSPFFGLHIGFAIVLAFLLRGNLLASLIGTFFGNPITFPVIAAASYNIGHTLLGTADDQTPLRAARHAFNEAASDVKRNLLNLLGSEPTSWDGVKELAGTILLPYSIGGLISGLVTSIAVYFVSKPLIEAYQRRRRLRFSQRRDVRAEAESDDQAADNAEGRLT